ncbi:MAG: hypothetical protein SGI72_17560 [Planctomycetota bacterium]|nr:hypothetical protein [Planctomycetota bacterium]
MKIVSSLAFIALPFAAQSALAQRVEPVNSLGRARSTYDASDADRNGRVTIEEFARQKLEIARVDFATMDVDKDGMWSREEFFVYYRRLLLNSGQRAADDLEAEVARIQAARRAKVAAQGRDVSNSAPKVPVAVPASIDDRLRAVIDELEKKAALRQATREDFKRVKDGLVERARQLNAQDPTVPSDLAAKFEASINALETKAREGNYNRDDFTALRESLIARGREAAKPSPVPASANVPLSEAQLQSALDSALDDLATKAEARSATRDDYTRVKEAFIARARAAAPNPALATDRVTLEQRFISAIDKLENDAREGRFTRAEFQTMRDIYVSRVRAIAGSGVAPSVPETPVNPAPATSGDLASQLDVALDQLATKAAERNATREDFGRVRDLMTARARAIAGSDPTAAGRLTTLDELFAKAMEKLETDAREGKFSRQEFQTLRDNYVNRARAIAGSGAPAVTPPTNPTPIPTEASTDGIEKRFDDALNELERKAVARGATRADFQRVNDLLVARARATVQAQVGAPVAEGDPRIAALAASLQGAMARLERASSEGSLSAADFANFKQMLVGRVRDVGQQPTPEGKAPEAKPVDPPKRPELPKPAEPQKTADNPPARTRPVPEQPKPVEPPKDEQAGRPVTPPHRD